MKRLAILITLLLAFAGPTMAIAAEPQASLPEIEDEVMCPVCGTLLGLSHSPAGALETPGSPGRKRICVA